MVYARALAKEIADGLISLGGPAEGFATCLVSTGGTVLDDGEDVTSPRASTAVKPLVALAYHLRYTTEDGHERSSTTTGLHLGLSADEPELAGKSTVDRVASIC